MTRVIFHPRKQQRGLTLIELLVAITIGLIVVLAVTSVLTIGEAQKRTTTSTNDMNQSGAYASYALDRAVRSAGSGFTQSWDKGAFGCLLTATRGGTSILPRAGAFPGAFAGFLPSATGTLRVAPLLIGKGQSSGGSDVLVTMSGNAAAGDIPRLVLDPGALGTNELRLANLIGLGASDLGLMVQDGTNECLFEQVGTPSVTAPEVLPLAGTYYHAADPYTAMRAGNTARPVYFVPVGNLTAGNTQFQMFGVGANRTLFSYDLLRTIDDGTDAKATQAVAEGVVAMHALYGVDTDPTPDGVFNAWVDPAATGYDLATVMTNRDTARRIVGVRVAMVLRASNYEKDVVSPPTLVVFGDLPAAMRRTIALSADDQHFRYRVVDSAIPVRNALLTFTTPTPPP